LGGYPQSTVKIINKGGRMANVISGKIWLRDGFNLGDLRTSFFGAHVYGEAPRYPLLGIEVSKTTKSFEWVPKKIWLLPYMIERQSPVEWWIKAKIYQSQKDEQAIFEYMGIYSTQHRISSGQIFAPWLEEQKCNFSDIKNSYFSLKEKEVKPEIGEVLKLAYTLWFFCESSAYYINDRDQCLALVNGLIDFTSDYRLEYLMKKLKKKLL